MTDKIRIVSDGLGNNTEVFFNEQKLPSIKKVVIHPITVDSLLSATITFVDVAVDISVNVDEE